jgi:hypothetical protein
VDAAITELQEATGGRADRLADAAGILIGARPDRAEETFGWPTKAVAGALCIAAGGDLTRLEEWNTPPLLQRPVDSYWSITALAESTIGQIKAELVTPRRPWWTVEHLVVDDIGADLFYDIEHGGRQEGAHDRTCQGHLAGCRGCELNLA